MNVVDKALLSEGPLLMGNLSISDIDNLSTAMPSLSGDASFWENIDQNNVSIPNLSDQIFKLPLEILVDHNKDIDASSWDNMDTLMNGNFKRTVSKDCDNSDEEKKKKKQVDEDKKEEELEATKMKMASAQLKLDGTTPNSPFPIKTSIYDKNWDKHFQDLKVCTYHYTFRVMHYTHYQIYSPTSLSISLFPNPNSLSLLVLFRTSRKNTVSPLYKFR